jgi:bifunctional DNA-binding transcriptional regulator/antitoxin component of YhaV-PrlF toxin-antitoxin module
METTGSSAGYRVRVDAKRRPTLPAAVLAAAGVTDSRELVVRADGPGRLVLEDPAILLAEFQAAVARGKAAVGFVGSLAEDLGADRAADADTDL